MENGDVRTKTRLPADLDEEKGMIIQWEFLRVSIRQLLLILVCLGLWAALFSGTSAVLSVSKLFTALLWSWIAIGGMYLALRTKDGRPLEHVLTDRIVFLISDRHFRPMDRKGGMTIADADWEETDEPYRW